MLKPPVDQYSAQGGNKLSRLGICPFRVLLWLISSARAENEDAASCTLILGKYG